MLFRWNSKRPRPIINHIVQLQDCKTLQYEKRHSKNWTLHDPVFNYLPNHFDIFWYLQEILLEQFLCDGSDDDHGSLWIYLAHGSFIALRNATGSRSRSSLQRTQMTMRRSGSAPSARKGLGWRRKASNFKRPAVSHRVFASSIAYRFDSTSLRDAKYWTEFLFHF